MAMIVCSRDTVRESLHLWQGPFLWSSATTGEHTLHVCLRDPQVSPFAWKTSGSLPFTWATSGSLLSVQIYRPLIVFSSPMQKYEHPLCLAYFSVYGWLLELTYFRGGGPVICWSYLQTEIFVTLSIGYKSYSLPSSFIFSFLWSTLLMLSCNCIESAKFIVAS